jgi:hypothetical protein
MNGSKRMITFNLPRHSLTCPGKVTWCDPNSVSTSPRQAASSLYSFPASRNRRPRATPPTPSPVCFPYVSGKPQKPKEMADSTYCKMQNLRATSVGRVSVTD